MTIKEFFQITRPLVVPDVETTGLDPRVARIIEIGFQVYYPDDKPMLEWRTLVDPGTVAISEQATKIHNIRTEDFRLCAYCKHEQQVHPGDPVKTPLVCPEYRRWPRFEEIAANIARGFTAVDFAGKNIRFDLQMIAAEMVRASVAWSYAGARVIDADRIEQLGDPRTLSALYEKHTGKKAENAHQALADVRMTTELIEAQLAKYHLPRSLDDLHELQWPGWIDVTGKFRFDERGEPRFSNWGKYAGRRMRDADVGYWDFVIKSDFSAEVKALASAAKLGNFPERKK